MSLVGERQEIATILDAIEGVTGYQYRPIQFNHGDAWPLLETMERGPANDFQVTWRVVVVLPNTEQYAMEWFDAMYEVIAAALEDFGYIDRIEPANLATEAGNRDCMLLTIRKEA